MFKVRIIDTLSHSTFHEIFNSAVVYMCIEIFDEVELRCSESTYANIVKIIKKHKTNVNNQALLYKEVAVLRKDTGLGGVIKYFTSGWVNFWQFLISPKNSQIVYTNNNPLSLWWINLFNLVLRKDILIFCHGELDLLLRSPKPYKPSFYYKYIYKLLFKYGIICSRIKMCVLGESILVNLQPFLSQRNKKRFFSIEHPYFFPSDIPEKNAHNMSQPIVIGTVGAMTKEKGLDSLLNISKEINPLSVKLTVVGRVLADINISDYKNINFIANGDKYIERERYEQAIQDLDYILFLYPADSYKLIASGAIFDAIYMGKPIITIKNDYFNHILKIPIGYTFDNEKEIAGFVSGLSDEPENYNVFMNNIKQLRLIYEVANVKLAFEKIIKCIYM